MVSKRESNSLGNSHADRGCGNCRSARAPVGGRTLRAQSRIRLTAFENRAAVRSGAEEGYRGRDAHIGDSAVWHVENHVRFRWLDHSKRHGKQGAGEI